MGSHYVYKVFRKIKIVKYCKRGPNHIYRTELLVCQLVIQHNGIDPIKFGTNIYTQDPLSSAICTGLKMKLQIKFHHTNKRSSLGIAMQRRLMTIMKAHIHKILAQ